MTPTKDELLAILQRHIGRESLVQESRLRGVPLADLVGQLHLPT